MSVLARARIRLPTRRDDWRLLARTARLVLSVPAYAAVAVVAAVASLTLFVVSQNVALVSDLVVGGSLPLDARLVVLAELYPFVGTSYSLAAGVGLLLVAAAVGVDVAMVVYHLREHRLTVSGSGSGLVGVVLGTLGAGCAACGPAILVGILSLVGATGLLTLLPFEGLELTALSLVALVLSMYWLADGMRGGEINGCPVDL
jgi:hypothetical protein